MIQVLSLIIISEVIAPFWITVILKYTWNTFYLSKMIERPYFLNIVTFILTIFDSLHRFICSFSSSSPSISLEIFKIFDTFHETIFFLNAKSCQLLTIRTIV